ncbi:MAG: DUF4139 domain-containing protein, partial [Sphingomonadales bacterium]|nr:DUF4139 domain-containing protein [Sphingomonadales bacterium]
MKPLSLSLVLLFSTAPAALLAAPVEAPSRVSAVTLFPWGAQVTRVIEVAGPGEVIVPDLPENTDPAGLRVAGEGVKIGAVTLIADRVPPSEAEPSEAVLAARAEVERLEAALAEKEGAVTSIRLRAEAARAQAEFLKGLNVQGLSPEQMAELSNTVGVGVLGSLETARMAEAEAARADLALKPDREALQAARRALAALEHPGTDHDALQLAVEGAGTVTITTFVADAGWSPAYDARLAADGKGLSLERFVSVHQASGEDWTGVDLTLSTARPSERVAASDLWPRPVRIGEPEPPVTFKAARAEADFAAAPMAAAPVVEAAGLAMQGITATYVYGAPVDIRDGVEDLRLRLGAVEIAGAERAVAVPMLDESAYREFEGVNGAEPILPGPVTLWADGAVVGLADLPPVAAGDRLRLGFGPIEGIRLKRLEPETLEGDRGLISKVNERREVVEISVENLTGRDWDLRVIDRAPYSEQEDLKIATKASPGPSIEDFDDKRG